MAVSPSRPRYFVIDLTLNQLLTEAARHSAHIGERGAETMHGAFRGRLDFL